MTYDSYNDGNIKYILSELCKHKEDYKKLFDGINDIKRNSIIKFLNMNYSLPQIKTKSETNGSFETYNDWIVQLKRIILNSLKESAFFANNNDGLKVLLSSNYTEQFDSMYKNIMEVKISKIKMFSKDEVSICINRYVIHDKYAFFLMSQGVLKLKGSIKKHIVKYNFSVSLNVIGIQIPDIEKIKLLI